MRKFISIFIICCAVNAFGNKISDAYEALSIFDYFKAKQLFYKSQSKFPCESSFGLATIYIVVDCQNFIVHNAFSPNNDGVNDNFIIDNIELFPNSDLQIFSRWGTSVFSTKGYKNDWNGMWNGKELPDGTYFYVLKYTDEQNKNHDKSGYLYLNR